MSKSPSIQSPVRIGAIWSSEPISSFSNLCIKSVVANAFDFTQVREFPPGWAVSLSFGFSTLGGSGEQFSVTLPGPFYSKKEAKAAAAVQGLKVLTEALAKKNNGDIRGDFDCNGDGGENENWIGLLGEYCQASRKTLPLYQEFELGSGFSMEVTISDRPNEPFGSREYLFNSKKAAKINAAREAVRWLRESEHLPKKDYPSMSSIRTAAAIGSNVAISEPIRRQSLAVGEAIEPDTSQVTAGAEKNSSLLFPPGQRNCSLGQQVTTLCRRIGCAQPIFKLTPDPHAPSIWSGAAFFAHDPAVALPDQPVGEVRMVFGKRKAKEEIARGVLKRLQEIMTERQEKFKMASADLTASPNM
ncbi:Double-stranded RNA-binding protein [Macrophomina phaseolina MS6]|uniref:Double-stranded RNA-binding protein n=1 Tax=Macrophomina phaseolina (strain MS6) TaxID=1126212 RepID=K2S4Z1_MACPH|nr:Double-stranded RNA-binding protein [Macrophomina phaseolina MS6]